MGYRYDFDMFSVIPDEIQKQFQGLFNDTGVSAKMTDQLALFRDPELVNALQHADEEIKQLFLDSGFGLNVFDSGAPTGRYPSYDESARNTCISRFRQNIAASKELVHCNWGGFQIAEFLMYLASAEPIDQIDMQAPAVANLSDQPRNMIAKVGLLAGGTLVMIAVVSILLK